eukprot:TRINITY_DN19463_c0_g1_i2.p1 TRINITY_DN19463_c0_g1~~TRINITY_DN19463_c0_g1_i2.p1  ORF type:complete len:237 (+),score=32.74 TRINITY_DN19463_c0_g1_i2:207-917(+)
MQQRQQWSRNNNRSNQQPHQISASGSRRSAGKIMAPGLRSFAVRGQPSFANTLPAFVLTRRAVASAGLFDENFWPAYAEDLDYLNRLKLVGGSRVGAGSVRDGTIDIIHGPDDWASGKHYSGVEQYAYASRSAKLAEKHRFVADESPAEAELARAEVRNQLGAANNYHVLFCLKFGRQGNVNENCSYAWEYASSGPFGVHGHTGWNDWILDPGRRLCITRAMEECSYDMNLLFQRR